MIRWCRAGVVGVLLGICASLAAAAGATHAQAVRDSVAFEFNPPDSIAFEQTLVTDRVKTFEGLGRQADHIVARTSITMRRLPGGRCVMTARPLHQETTRDGKPIDDPVLALLSDVVVTSWISADGTIDSVRGYEGVEEKIRKTMPEAMARGLAGALSRDALVARDRTEWSGRVGDFVGTTRVIGQAREVDVPLGLPNGQALRAHMRIVVSGRESCAPGKCVRVDVRYDSNGEALANFVAGISAKMIGADSTSVGAGGSRMFGSASRLIDPKTMLIYAETMSRTMMLAMEIPGHGKVPARMEEERRYSYRY